MEKHTEQIRLTRAFSRVSNLEQNKKLKIFISYSHKDNNSDTSYIEQFKKQIAPLRDNGLIEDWYDRVILPGEDYQDKINTNLEDADIICLFISANFLDSERCIYEKKKALELRNKKGVQVIPIILSPCGWKEYKNISKLLALPTDGMPVSNFHIRDVGWQDVYEGLKKIIEKEIKIKQLKIEEEFEDFLYSAEMLTKAHPKKENVFLDDVFIYPDLDKYSSLREHVDKISSEELLKNILDYPKIVIAGENQSGKTTLCKMIFKELRDRNLIPVYVSDKNTYFLGEIENRISRSLRKQYKDIDVTKIDKERIVPIIDDFHHAKDKERHIKDLSGYTHCIIIVDDIFGLNIRDEELISSFFSFRINVLKPSLRYELVEKWVSLTDKEVSRDNYKIIDKNTDLIDSILGKNIGKGIMPAYPFFVLSTIVAYETFAIPLDQEITSQGYCYQAFIYFYLRKNGVKNDEIDSYINFLTEFAFHIYKEKKEELTPHNFTSFMESYVGKYNLPIKQEILLENLSQIVSQDCFGNYSFRYLYLYYFFVAKYLADHIEDDKIKVEIDKLIKNLQVDENAYITVFITHHSKNINILKGIECEASCLFDKYKLATLTKDEVKFFDEQADIIVKAVLPPANITPQKKRMELLKIRDEFEKSQENIEQKEGIIEEDFFEKELRRAVKTVEVMGCIIKNRAGSLERVRLEKIFAEGMSVHLRILSCALKIIENEDEQQTAFDYIVNILRKIVEEKKEGNGEISEDQLRKHAKIIFWNLNFLIVCGIIYKIVHSLGSDKLINIMNKVCDEVNTPASILVKHGILMEYSKNLQINELTKRSDEKDFSEIAKRTIKFMIVNHCSLHKVNQKERQRIEALLGIPAQKLLPRS
jgi:uridine kinase